MNIERRLERLERIVMTLGTGPIPEHIGAAWVKRYRLLNKMCVLKHMGKAGSPEFKRLAEEKDKMDWLFFQPHRLPFYMILKQAAQEQKIRQEDEGYGIVEQPA